MSEDISEIDYAKAGVSIKAQNEVNEEIKKKLTEMGLVAEGLFGGVVDISHLKGKGSVPIGVICASIVEDEDPLEAGKKTTAKAFEEMRLETEPIALLDYFASIGMDTKEVPSFVDGVALAGLEKKVPTIGGESAQMPQTYQSGKRDAYVHLVFHGKQGIPIDIADKIKNMERPFLCASTDGTGTKTLVVRDPSDIIHHGSNDIGAIGVQPVAFALYVAGNVPKGELEEVVAKSHKACNEFGITALDPTIEYKPGVYVFDMVDIAGTVIGVVDEKDLVIGRGVTEGNIIIGLATDRLMTNGYSLARKYLEKIGDNPDDENVPGLRETTIRKELSKPHILYTDILFGNEKVEGILSKFKGKVKAMAHITGGGQKDNIKRMVPEGLCAFVQKGILPLPPIIRYFRDNGANMDAMYEAFNMGVGFTVTVARDSAEDIIKYVNENFRKHIEGVDREAAKIGEIKTGVNRFEFVD